MLGKDLSRAQRIFLTVNKVGLQCLIIHNLMDRYI